MERGLNAFRLHLSRERFQNEMRNQTKIIEDEIKRYYEKYREVQRSKEEYERIDEDKSHSKLDVERVSSSLDETCSVYTYYTKHMMI